MLEIYETLLHQWVFWEAVSRQSGLSSISPKTYAKAYLFYSYPFLIISPYVFKFLRCHRWLASESEIYHSGCDWFEGKIGLYQTRG